MNTELPFTIERYPAHLGIKAGFRLVAMYLRRSARLWLRFPVSFTMDLLGNLAGAATFAFIGVALVRTTHAGGTGNDYVSYVILGMIITSFTSAGISGPYESLSETYWGAQLESILLSPSSLSLRMLSDVLWSLTQAAFRGTCYALLGLAFGMKLHAFTAPALLPVILVLAPISALGIGFASASTFMLLNAKGWNDPIRWTVTTLEGLVCGAYFPILALPVGVRWISYCLPQTYVLDAARLILLPGYSSPLRSGTPGQVLEADLLILMLFAVATIPLGLFALRWGLHKARCDGGLSRWA